MIEGLLGRKDDEVGLCILRVEMVLIIGSLLWPQIDKLSRSEGSSDKYGPYTRCVQEVIGKWGIEVTRIEVTSLRTCKRCSKGKGSSPCSTDLHVLPLALGLEQKGPKGACMQCRLGLALRFKSEKRVSTQ